MRPRSFLAITLVLAVTKTALVAAQPSPRLVVAEPIHDAGLVRPDQRVAHAFLLHNEGTVRVRVTGVHAACGCTVAEYDHEIAAGASGRVKAAIDTTNFRNGPFSKTIAVTTDDPALPEITLTLRGEIQPAVLADPNRLRWTATAAGLNRDVRTVSVWAPVESDFQVTGVETTDSWLVATYREASAEERPVRSHGRVWRVEVRLDPLPPPGAIHGELRVRTNHPDEPVTVVPVSGYVPPATASVPK